MNNNIAINQPSNMLAIFIFCACLFGAHDPKPCTFPSNEELEKIWVPVADPKNPAGYKLEQQPILFPYRILTYIFSEVGLEIGQEDIEQYWDNAIAAGEPHANESSRGKVPLGLYGDSAQLITKIRKEKLLCLWLNIPIFRPKAVRYSRFLIWCIDNSLLLENKTTNSVLRWVVWSLNSLFEGFNPSTRPGGRPLTPEEELRAEKPFTPQRHSFQVVELRGDWEYHKFLWKFSSSWKGLQTCFKCPCLSKSRGDDGMLYWDVTENNSWSRGEFTATDFINHQLPKRHICTLNRILKPLFCT